MLAHRRHDISDKVWELLAPHLPGKQGSVGRPAEDNRLFINAVFWVLRTGAPWRDLPPGLGNWKHVQRRFCRWRDRGIWEKLLEIFIEEPDYEWLMIDASHCKVHPDAAGARGGNQDMSRIKGDQKTECIGRSKGGLTTKIHARCDALGNPTGFHLTPGQACDLEGADVLLPDILANIQAFLADKAYDAQERVLALLEKAGVKIIIPSKSNRKQQRPYDQDIYKARHLIENFFAKLKQSRAIATRYDKRAIAFLGGIYSAATAIWLN